MKYRKKPVEIEALTFNEMIELGKEQLGDKNLTNGMPWSFTINDHPITHKNDKEYLISTLEGDHLMTQNDMLIIGVKGEIYPCKIDIFNMTYEKA